MSQAVSLHLNQYKNEILSLRAKRQALFKSEDEFNALVRQAKADSQKLVGRVIINDKLELEKEFTTQISLPVGYEATNESALGGSSNSGVILSLVEWDLHGDGIMAIKAENM